MIYQHYNIKLFLTTLCLFFGIGGAMGEDTPTVGVVTIVPNNAFWGTSYSGTIDNLPQNPLDLTGSQEGVTVNVKSNTSDYGFINDQSIRVNSYYTMSFSVPSEYKITKIQFDPEANNWGGKTSVSVGSLTDNSKTWTASAKSVVQSVTCNFNTKCYIASIKVTVDRTSELPINIQTVEGYATFCNVNPFVLPDGLRGATAEVNGDDLTWNWQYNGGDVVPAKTPILVYGSVGTYTAREVQSSDAKPAINFLYYNDKDWAQAASYIATECKMFYALGYGVGDNANKLGFYWLEENGDSFSVPAGKVFLAIPANVRANARIGFGDETAAVKAVIEASNSKNNVAFNLKGQRVNMAQKGIIVVNGKKIYNK